MRCIFHNGYCNAFFNTQDSTYFNLNLACFNLVFSQ